MSNLAGSRARGMERNSLCHSYAARGAIPSGMPYRSKEELENGIAEYLAFCYREKTRFRAGNIPELPLDTFRCPPYPATHTDGTLSVMQSARQVTIFAADRKTGGPRCDTGS